MGQKVVVVGGGFGGVAAARMVRSLLDRQHEVTLVDRERRTFLCGSFPMLIVGERRPTGVSRSLGLLANRGVRYLQAGVTGIDVASKTVTTSAGKMDYDYLVLAPGAAYDWDAVPGASSAYSFYDIHSARRLRRKLAAFRRGRVIIAVSSVPYKCPPAPFEAAMVLDWAFKRRGVRADIELHVYTPEPMPLPVAGPEANPRLVRAMERKGVIVHTGAAVTEVAPNGREMAFGDGSGMDCDLAITVPTHRAPPVVAAAGLSGAPGWIVASPKTLETSHKGVYCVGDANTVPMANGKPLPKAGVFASSAGETVGRNIAAAINNTEPTEFPGVGQCFISHSGSLAGTIRGQFLAEGKPNVEIQPATARGHRARERFERDWKRFRI